MLNVNKLSSQVVADLQKRGHTLEDIAQMTPQQAFSEFCQWHGLIGWGDKLWDVVAGLHSASTPKISIEIEIATAEGIVLDYLVAIAEGMTIPVEKFIKLHMDGKRNYSANPAQAYLITLRERISTKTSNSNIEPWEAYDSGCGSNCTGTTPLIAAMRCHATSKFGATFKVPVMTRLAASTLLRRRISV